MVSDTANSNTIPTVNRKPRTQTEGGVEGEGERLARNARNTLDTIARNSFIGGGAIEHDPEDKPKTSKRRKKDKTVPGQLGLVSSLDKPWDEPEAEVVSEFLELREPKKSLDSERVSSTRWNKFSQHPRWEEIATEIDSLPGDWRLMAVSEKKNPANRGWQEGETRDAIRGQIRQGAKRFNYKGIEYLSYAGGVALLTGDGVMAIDVDCEEALHALEAINGDPMPNSVSFGSGKPGRMQVLYRVPQRFLVALEGFGKAKIDEWGGDKLPSELAFRYERVFSVLPPSHHPETGSYGWIASPKEIEMAELPEAIARFVLDLSKKTGTQTSKELDRVEKERVRSKSPRTGNDLIDFIQQEVYPELGALDIYSDPRHNFTKIHGGYRGNPLDRASESGESFHVDFVKGRWVWFDRASDEGGDPFSYLHRSNGGRGYPKGQAWWDIAQKLANLAGVEVPPGLRQWSKTDESGKVIFDEEAKKAWVLKQWRERAKAKVQPHAELNDRYLQTDLIEKLPDRGIIAIDSAKGSGKSRSVIKPSIERWKKEGKRIISITPRVALGREQAAKFDITWVDDAGASTQSLGICWDSLHKFADLGWDCIIIDEARLALKHLLFAPTAIKSVRQQTLAALEDIFESALVNDGTVILADADLSDLELDFFRGIAPEGTPFFFVRNNDKGDSVDCTVNFGDRAETELRLKKAVDRAIVAETLGEKPEPIIGFFDSRREEQAIVSELKKNYPDLADRFWQFDGDSTQLKGTQERLKDINGAIERERPLFLGYTSSMNIGVSIDCGYFKHRFAFYFGVLSPSEFRQGLARERAPIPTEIWAGRNGLSSLANGSIEPDEVWEQKRRDTLKSQDSIQFVLETATAELCEHNDSISDSDVFAKALELSQSREANPAMVAWASIAARENFSMKYLDIVLIHELKVLENWNITVVEESIEDEKERGEFSDDLKAQRELSKIKERQIKAVGYLDKEKDGEWAYKIEKSASSTREESLMAQGVRLRERYPGANAIAKVEEGEAPMIKEEFAPDSDWESRQFLGFCLEYPEVAKILTGKSHIHHARKVAEGGEVFLPGISTLDNKVKALTYLRVPELIECKEELTKDSPIVKEIFELALKSSKRVKGTLGITIAKKSKPIKFVAALVDKVGLDLISTGRSTKARKSKIAGHSTLRSAVKLDLFLRYEESLNLHEDAEKWESCPISEPRIGEIAQSHTGQSMEGMTYFQVKNNICNIPARKSYPDTSSLCTNNPGDVLDGRATTDIEDIVELDDGGQVEPAPSSPETKTGIPFESNGWSVFPSTPEGMAAAMILDSLKDWRVGKLSQDSFEATCREDIQNLEADVESAIGFVRLLSGLKDWERIILEALAY